MRTRVPEEFITLLRQKIDIVDVISEYVRLRKAGRSYVGLCPFHSEKSPSFNVTPGKGYYYCFGCGAGGTVINFIMELEQLSFPQALEKLAGRAGLVMPQVDTYDADDAVSRERASLLQVHELATKFYNHILMNHDGGTQGLSYLLQRGLTKKTVSQWWLGYSPRNGRALVDFLRKRDVPHDVMVTAGLALVNDHGEVFDRFRGRVMFPVHDLQGRVIGFGARTLGQEQPKYLNSQETPLFHKGNVLYGFHRARQGIRQTGQVILCEGYMDILALHQNGITNAVATLGTALTPVQAGLLHRVSEDIVLLYDGDRAGQNAAAKSIALLGELDVNLRVAKLPDGVDPDEWFRTGDPVRFTHEVLGQAVSALAFQLQRLTHAHPEHMSSGRLQYLREALAVVAQSPSSLEREAALQWLSETYSMSVNALRDDLELQRKSLASRKKADTTSPVRESSTQRTALATAPVPQGVLPERQEVAERNLLLHMMQSAHVADEVAKAYPWEFSKPIHSALQAYVYMFYATHTQADPELLLNSIDDPQVAQFAVSVLQEAPDTDELHENDRFPALIRDYIDCLLRDRLDEQLLRVADQMTVAGMRGDFDEMRVLQLQYKKLQEAMLRPGVGVQDMAGS